MKALVTGGNGFLGRYIVEKLKAEDHDVRVIGRNKYPELEAQGVECLVCDIQDRINLSKACKDVDTVFHVAAKVGLWGPWEEFYRTNVIGTKNLLEACVQAGVKRFIYTSTPSVVSSGKDIVNGDESLPYPKHFTSNYPKSKSIAEKMVIEANNKKGLLTCSLRPHLLWGPRDNHLVPQILARAKQGKLIIVGKGDNVVDFTYVENAADAHILAAKHLEPGSAVAGQCYFISQDEPIGLWDFVNKVLDAHHVPRPKKKISLKTANVAASVLEFIYKTLPLSGEPRLTRFLAQQLATSHHFSLEKAKRDFNYTPSISIKEGIERLIREGTESSRNSGTATDQQNIHAMI